MKHKNKEVRLHRKFLNKFLNVPDRIEQTRISRKTKMHGTGRFRYCKDYLFRVKVEIWAMFALSSSLRWDFHKVGIVFHESSPVPYHDENKLEELET